MYKVVIRCLILLLVVNVATSSNLFAAGTIQGEIFDEVTGIGVPYANAVLYKYSDSVLIVGVASDDNGVFILNNIAEGKYFLSIQSLGYLPKIISEIEISSLQSNVKLDKVNLSVSSHAINDVVVRGQRSSLVFEDDKKVLNVGADITSLGGSAIDAAKKLPSVQVDYEGNISIRGSGNFKVLINGKPTTLSGQEELEKIPVNMIEKLELITNASAEYDPDGSATIINVITTKQSIKGLNGMVETAYNFNDSKSVGFRLGYKLDKLSINTGFKYDNDHWLYRNEFYQTTYDDLRQIENDRIALGKFTNLSNNYNYNLGLDYSPDTNNFFSFSGSLTYTDKEDEMDNDYSEQYANVSGTSYSNSLAYRTHVGPQYSVNGTYEHYFNSQLHKLSFNVYYFGFSQNHDNKIDNSNTDSNWIIESPNSYYYRTNEVVRSDLKLSASYSMPIKDRFNINTGYIYTLYNRNDLSITNTDFPSSDISIYDQEPLLDGDYSRNIHAVFGTFGGSIQKLQFAVGLRMEAYQRLAKLNVEDNDWDNSLMDLFPSLNLTYKMENEKQFGLSYSKRTFRPYSWMVFRIPTYHNKNYVYIGNPELLPMYMNNAEFSFLKKWDGMNIYSELFYSHREKSIQTVFVPDSNGVRVGYPVNVDHHFSGGSSTMLTYNKPKWLNLQQGFDLYYNEITSEQTYSSLSYNVSTKVNISLKDYVNITLNANYYGASASAQGEVQGRIYSDIGVSKTLFKKRATIALTVWDPFKLTSYDSKRTGDGYVDRYYYYNDNLNFNIYFSYRFNNYEKGGSGISSGSNPSFLTQ